MSFPPPEEVIPHRPPFLLLTAVTSLTPGVSAIGHWDLTGEEEFFSGHFPGRPTLPGVLQCESIAQLGAYALLSDEKFSGRLALFGGIVSFGLLHMGLATWYIDWVVGAVGAWYRGDGADVGQEGE